jgi:hypothetical protein
MRSGFYFVCLPLFSCGELKPGFGLFKPLLLGFHFLDRRGGCGAGFSVHPELPLKFLLHFRINECITFVYPIAPTIHSS